MENQNQIYKNRIFQEFSKAGFSLTEEQVNQFYDYYEMLIETNKVMNLTAITEFEDVLQKHFIDSVMETGTMIQNDEKSLIDVGTGAGFPGIPLKIIYPELNITLLDSLNKRLNFLNTVIEKLQLKKIKTVHFRAEDGARSPELREQFDYAVSRAVANLSTLCEYCLPYVKKNGLFISYKADYKEELQAAKHAVYLLGGTIEKVHEFCLSDTAMNRSLILIRKKETTPKKYPRKAGLPGKEPLK